MYHCYEFSFYHNVFLLSQHAKWLLEGRYHDYGRIFYDMVAHIYEFLTKAMKIFNFTVPQNCHIMLVIKLNSVYLMNSTILHFFYVVSPIQAYMLYSTNTS